MPAVVAKNKPFRFANSQNMWIIAEAEVDVASG